MSWWQYVTRTSGTESPKAMAASTGIDGPNFSRWKAGHVPKVEMVAQFARAYHRPVLESFVAAGFLTAAEARSKPASAPDYSQLTNDELLELVRQRMGEQHAATTSQPGVSPGEPSRSERLNAAAEGLLAGVPPEAAEQARLAKRAMQDRAERTQKRQP